MWKTILWFAIMIGCAAPWCMAQLAPPTKADPVTDTLHGVKITDPYRWLEDQNSPPTREWLAAQDKFARAYLDGVPGRDALRRKFEALLKIESVGTPSVRHGRFSGRRRADVIDLPIVRQGSTARMKCWTRTPPPTTPPRPYSTDISETADWWFWLASRRQDEVSVRFLGRTRQYLPDTLPRGRASASPKPDQSGFITRFVGVGSLGSHITGSWRHGQEMC